MVPTKGNLASILLGIGLAAALVSGIFLAIFAARIGHTSPTSALPPLPANIQVGTLLEQRPASPEETQQLMMRIPAPGSLEPSHVDCFDPISNRTRSVPVGSVCLPSPDVTE